MTQRISVCSVDDLQEGQMRSLSVAEREVLLVRSKGSIYATAAHCSHYGAPLAKGVLHGERVVCPWHNACFNIASGAQLEPPGRDHLARYPVEVRSNTVYVELPEDGAEHVAPPMSQPDAEDGRKFVIVGGGAAGAAAAETLRQIGFQGHIVVLSAEKDLPYDRTKLSKAALQGESSPKADLLRPEDFYQKHGIEMRAGAVVSAVAVSDQKITLETGETLEYDALLLATGGRVKPLLIDGADRQNVFTLRQTEDAQAIFKAAQHAKQAVIIGSGFIGMEVAASLKQQGLDVTVVAPNIPFENVLGKPVGEFFQRVHEAEGVRFKLGQKVTAVQGNDKAEAVQLDSGEVLPVDLVVVGIGVQPATEFLNGIALHEQDHSVPVNQYLQAAPGVFAAGDIARFPHFLTGEPVRIEHWRLAMQHGRIAAHNMMGQSVPFKAVPFFWSGQFDIKLRYVGHAENWDELVIQGSLDEKKFLAFYLQQGEVMAVAGVGRDQDIAAVSELLRLKQMPSAAAVKQTDRDWVQQLAKFDSD